MYGNDNSINIRTIQHFLYCPHRWGLLEVDRAWAENAFVVKADLLHSRVHDPDKSYTTRNKKVFTSVQVYNDDYGLFGVTDCIEAVKNPEGAEVNGEKYRLTIVEYKPTLPKSGEFNDDDAMQVFAQKLCVDYTFNTDCDGVIYYADAKKRVPLPFDKSGSDYKKRILEILDEIRKNLESGIIPSIIKGQKCSGCSMKDLCMPSKKVNSTLRNRITGIMEEDS